MLRSAYTSLQIIFYLVLAVLLTQTISNSNADTNCNECSEHGIACASQTQYYICENGTILIDKLEKCEENKVCIHTFKDCQDKSTLEPTCNLAQVSFCGVCSKKVNETTDGTKNSPFAIACIGPNFYKFCKNGAISHKKIKPCKPGKVCSMPYFEKTGHPCIKKGKKDEYPASCSDTSKLVSTDFKLACKRYDTKKTCYNAPNPFDSECESYLRCNRKSGLLRGRVVKCGQGEFYDNSKNKCTDERPSVCDHVQDLTTTTTASPSSTTSSTTESS